MKLLWSKPIPMDNPWEPACAGVFCRFADTVHFLYKDGKAVAVLAEDSETARKIPAGDHTIPLPGQWILSDNIVFLNEELLFDIFGRTFADLSGTTLAAEYTKLRKPEKYYVEASFSHDGYEISHKGDFGYQCTKDGETIWEFRGQGYLYTDICFRENRVFFGTAGQGGYFYVLDLETGEPLTKIKTGGTASFAVKDGCCYVLTNEKTAKLLCVDLKDGRYRDELELPGRASVYSRLFLAESRIHIITFSVRRRILQHSYWNCSTI